MPSFLPSTVCKLLEDEFRQLDQLGVNQKATGECGTKPCGLLNDQIDKRYSTCK